MNAEKFTGGFGAFAETNVNIVVVNNVANGNVVTVGSVRLFNTVDKFVYHCLFLYREPARAVVFYLEPGTKVIIFS